MNKINDQLTAIKVLIFSSLALLTSCQHPDFASILNHGRDTIPTPPTTDTGTPGDTNGSTITIHINDRWQE